MFKPILIKQHFSFSRIYSTMPQSGNVEIMMLLDLCKKINWFISEIEKQRSPLNNIARKMAHCHTFCDVWYTNSRVTFTITGGRAWAQKQTTLFLYVHRGCNLSMLHVYSFKLRKRSSHFRFVQRIWWYKQDSIFSRKIGSVNYVTGVKQVWSHPR